MVRKILTAIGVVVVAVFVIAFWFSVVQVGEHNQKVFTSSLYCVNHDEEVQIGLHGDSFSLTNKLMMYDPRSDRLYTVEYAVLGRIIGEKPFSVFISKGQSVYVLKRDYAQQVCNTVWSSAYHSINTASVQTLQVIVIEKPEMADSAENGITIDRIELIFK